MEIRFLIDLDTGEPHCAAHGVAPLEAIQVIRRPGELSRGRNDSLIAGGQTSDGRYLRVVYKKSPLDGSIFVITSYDMSATVRRAYRRRRKKK